MVKFLIAVAGVFLSEVPRITGSISSEGKLLRGAVQEQTADLCETANSFCNILSKGSSCEISDFKTSRGLCSGTDKPCHCVGVKEYNRKYVRTTTTTPSPPVPKPNASCGSDFPQKAANLTLWVEWPTLGDDAAVDGFFADILAYLTKNCANIRTTKLILRVLSPSFNMFGSTTALHPQEDSPLYSKLIKKLPKSVQLHFYPYVMDKKSQAAWEKFGAAGQTNIIANVYKFVAEWNVFLATVGAPTVKGIIIDNEELRGLPNYAEVLNIPDIARIKNDLEFGVTIGFDELTRLNTWSPYVDEFYLQVYDLYTPTADVYKTPNSPFVKMENDAAAMANFVVNEAVTPKIWEAYKKVSSKITLMWSLQTLGKSCLYPLNGENCGGNYEFGSWTAAAFNEFINAFNNAAPASFEHAIFQFSFLPKSWTSE